MKTFYLEENIPKWILPVIIHQYSMSYPWLRDHDILTLSSAYWGDLKVFPGQRGSEIPQSSCSAPVSLLSGHVWKNSKGRCSGGILIRRPSHLSWLLLIQRSSDSTPSPPPNDRAPHLSCKAEPVTLLRKLISVARIQNHVLSVTIQISWQASKFRIFILPLDTFCISVNMLYPVRKISHVYSTQSFVLFLFFLFCFHLHVFILRSPAVLFLSVSSSPSFQMSALSVVCLSQLSSSVFWFSTSLFHSITVSINRNLVGWRCSQQQWQRMINFFPTLVFFVFLLSFLVQFKN